MGIAGDPRHSIEVLSGAPASRYPHGEKNASQIFDLVKSALPIDSMVSASTADSSNGNQDKSARGIAQSHVYTVLNAFEVQNSNGQTVRLYRIRNPWGVENYTGPFSDMDSTNWDTSLQNAVGYLDENDGTFFIDAATYH